MSEKAFKDLKIRFHLAIGVANGDREDFGKLSDWIEEENWEMMDEEEQKDTLSENAEEWAQQYLDLGATVE
ncbi:hypothetical protein SOJ40_16225 [Acinetobacter baumannii]|uniref:DUF7167 family protein n=1 Tax=Acinetobacter baumannii TaxID=470 RepID=UPI002A6A3371|nr:hypothetical protein [Acinetobacter baumannii]MDY1572221.1 hypothetical protein [Acinetobacter baumannii]